MRAPMTNFDSCVIPMARIFLFCIVALMTLVFSCVLPIAGALRCAFSCTTISFHQFRVLSVERCILLWEQHSSVSCVSHMAGDVLCVRGGMQTISFSNNPVPCHLGMTTVCPLCRWHRSVAEMLHWHFCHLLLELCSSVWNDHSLRTLWHC